MPANKIKPATTSPATPSTEIEKVLAINAEISTSEVAPQSERESVAEALMADELMALPILR